MAQRCGVRAPPIDVVGATLGFLGWAGGLHLHSHMNAVDPGARGRGVGVALKLRQRAICLAHGVTEMRWTYDPLIRRNARLNLVRLGAEVVAFLPDFYGELRDAITGTDRSDRFEVRWRMDSPRTARALARGPQPEWRPEGGLALVADFEHVRAQDPEVAGRPPRGLPRRRSPRSGPTPASGPSSTRAATTCSPATTPTGRPDDRHDRRDRPPPRP